MDQIQKSEDCLFCKIVSGEETADKVYENESFIVIKNKFPNAPTHLLIISKVHLLKQETLTNTFDVWKGFFKTQSEVVKKLNLGDLYQLVINAPGMAHFHHEHMHLIAGRDLFDK